jgi:RNA polymerase subunit RPABC4/transcription elongation factor Spt4
MMDTSKYQKQRKLFRTIGPILLIAGVSCIGVALFDFFSVFGDFNAGPPKLFGLMFLGMPLVFLGVLFTYIGYMRAVADYGVREMAPVASNAFNYIAKETKPGFQSVASAFKGEEVECRHCHVMNDQDAKFCNNCGSAMMKICSSCNEENQADSKYCKQCGQQL